MATDRVRIWRPADECRVLLMAGQTTHYAIEPRGEYVFGIVAGQAMRSRRAAPPGPARSVGCLDPSNAHAGTAVEDRPWSSERPPPAA
jgi:hypothetical protein